MLFLTPHMRAMHAIHVCCLKYLPTQQKQHNTSFIFLPRSLGAFDPNNQSLTFTTTKLAPLAVLASRTACLPFNSWICRPIGPGPGVQAMIHLDVGLQFMVWLQNGVLLQLSCGAQSISHSREYSTH